MQQALVQAQLLIEHERPDEALEVLTTYLASVPDDPRAWCLVAQCRIGLDDADSALQAARTALGLRPEWEWPHRLASIALTKLRRFGEARAAADEAVRLAPELWLAHRQRAEVDVQAGQIDDRTHVAARHTVELAPNEPAAHVTAGRVYLASKDNRHAEAAFRTALQLDPNSAVARNNLAVTHIRRRRLGSAARHLIGALHLEPDSPLFAANLRTVLRTWAALLDLLGVIGCVVLLDTTGGHDVTRPVTGTGVQVTLSPGTVVRIPANELPPVAQHVAATGRPAVLVVVPVVLVLALVAIVAAVRRSIGPRTGRILRAALRADGALRTMVATSLLGVAAVVAAAAVGLPSARGLAGAALVINAIATVITRVVGGPRRRNAG